MRTATLVLFSLAGTLGLGQNYTYTLVADSTGAIDTFSSQTMPPSMANNGSVLYYARLDSSAGDGFYYWDGATTHTVKFDPVVGDLNGFFAPANVSEDGLSVIMKNRFGANPRIEGWTLDVGNFIVYDQIPSPYNGVQPPDFVALGECCFSGSAPGANIVAKGWPSSFTTIQSSSVGNFSLPTRIDSLGRVAYQFTPTGGPKTLYRSGVVLESLTATLLSIKDDVGMNATGTVAFICTYSNGQHELAVHDGAVRTSVIHTSGPYANLSFQSGPAINNHGNIAFYGTTDNPGAKTGVFGGPVPETDYFLRNGDVVLGKTIMVSSGFWSGGLNDRGQAAIGVTFSDGVRATVLATPKDVTISGNVLLEDYVGSQSQAVSIELIGPGGESHPAVPLDPSGDFSITTNTRGTYDIRVKGSHWLAKKVGSITVWHSGVSGLSFSLKNGDIDGDNVVTLLDYDIFSTYFDKNSADTDWMTPGPNGFAPFQADIDGDGAVTLLDYDIYSKSFDETGD